jgi:hypothetical protein
VVDPDNVRVLANCADDLPPIPLQKTTLRVIDGMRRQQRLDSMEKQKADANTILASLRRTPA